MCGVFGVWSRSAAEIPDAAFEACLDRLAHRGPDGRGSYRDPDCRLRLGHLRLAILDPTEAGRQPMAHRGGRYWITLNGEIYNFLELRRELEGLGQRFRTESDTEVVLAAYETWGPDCQLRFNGMWAFALWDLNRRTLFLSRDRFGVKPMHWLLQDGRFAFSSELKGFLGLPGFQAAADPANLTRALRFHDGLEGTEDCWLRGVRRLPGGHCLTLAADGPPVLRRWWNTLEHLEAPPATLEGAAGRLRELFLEACALRMRSDVPVGSALSGGLDSSSVVCAMASLQAADPDRPRIPADWRRAFVACFPGTAQDERPWAELAVRHCGAVPTYLDLDPGECLAHLDEVAYMHEDVIPDLPGTPWLLYRELRRHGIVVSLDGHGGDELLAGYHHHVTTAMADPAAGGDRRRVLGAVLEAMTVPAAAAPPPTGDWPIPKTPWLPAEPAPFRYAQLASDQEAALDALGFDPLNRRLYLDFHCGLLPTNLRDFDRLAMAHGVEIRAPFLDWRLVCFVQALPSAFKLGEDGTKLVLRRAMAGILPDPIRERRSKIGFASPLAEWVRDRLKPFILDTLASRDFLESPHWRGEAVRAYVDAAYANGDHARVSNCWGFIQAHRLMAIFADAARNPTSGVRAYYRKHAGPPQLP